MFLSVAGLIPPNAQEMKGCFELKTVEISDGIERVDKGAFTHCFSLRNLAIPPSVIVPPPENEALHDLLKLFVLRP